MTSACYMLSVIFLLIGWRPMCGHSYFCILDALYCNVRHILYRQVWYRMLLCTMRCVYSMFGHHPHPSATFMPNFVSVTALRCSASPWRKIAYSINHLLTHSVTHAAYLMRREPKLMLRNVKN